MDDYLLYCGDVDSRRNFDDTLLDQKNQIQKVKKCHYCHIRYKHVGHNSAVFIVMRWSVLRTNQTPEFLIFTCKCTCSLQ